MSKLGEKILSTANSLAFSKLDIIFGTYNEQSFQNPKWSLMNSGITVLEISVNLLKSYGIVNH